MYKLSLLVAVCLSLTACAEFEARQTNCFTSAKTSLSMVDAAAPVSGCDDWVQISD
jgi:hypothetical protein